MSFLPTPSPWNCVGTPNVPNHPTLPHVREKMNPAVAPSSAMATKFPPGSIEVAYRSSWSVRSASVSVSRRYARYQSVKTPGLDLGHARKVALLHGADGHVERGHDRDPPYGRRCSSRNAAMAP